MKYSFFIIVAVCIFIGSSAAAQYDTCAELKGFEPNGHLTDKEAQRAKYDTLRLYIEKCAATDPGSYFAFTSIDGALYLCSEDPKDYFEYRDWLISVLYLNTTVPFYFCRCVMSMALACRYSNYDPTNTTIAVLRYLRSNPKCNDEALQEQITQDSIDLIHTGKDTTIPSLGELGLGFLLNSSGVAPNLSSPKYLVGFTAKPNPFTTELQLRFHLNRMSYCSLQIVDILGNQVFAVSGRTYMEGDHEMIVDGKSLPSGMFYVRISTGFGEVKTIKLIKE